MQALKLPAQSLTSLLSITGSTTWSIPRNTRTTRREGALLARVQAAGFEPARQAKRPAAPERDTVAAPEQSRKGAVRGASSGGSRNASGALRLNKALAAAGLVSRRGADEMVFAGRVSVNGRVVKEPGVQVMLGRDKLSVDGRQVSTAAALSKYYFALNKPKGYICSTKGDDSGGSGDRLVLSLFDEWLRGWKRRHPGSGAPPRLFTVGRLDVASIGLVLVTNDGDWAQAVQHPSSGLTKEYSVTLEQRPGRQQLDAFAAGCDVDGARVVPVAVALDDSDRSKPNRIRVVLAEGRNREVRRLAEAAGMEVKVLRRVRVGGYRMPRSLAFGQFVELRPHDVRRVLNIGADRTV